MKNVVTKIAILVWMACNVLAESEDVDWTRWQEARNKDLAIALQLPHQERIPVLGGLVRASRPGLHRYTWPAAKSEFFRNVQNEMIRIPGHAQYFADELERLRVESGDGYSIRKRCWYIQDTLAYLPSPETILVLGRYLSDDRDPIRPRTAHQDWSDIEENCFLATRALVSIGLRNAPVNEIRKYRDLDALTKARVWWEEVSSGGQTFSFKGMSMEYRFKPDGTWESLAISNPPDDGSREKQSGDASRRERRPSQDAEHEDPVTGTRGVVMWMVIAGTLVALLAALGILRRSSKE